MDFSNLPAPSSYDDWKSWAAMLVQQLQTQGGESAQNYPLWIEDSSKERGGLPAAADGDVVRVKSEDGTISLKYWDEESGSWKATADTSGLESQVGNLESQVESQLAEKLDLDLGNLAVEGYPVVTNLALPQQSREIFYGNTTSWTLVPEDGWVYCYTTNGAGAQAWRDNGIEVSLDGSTKAFQLHYTSFWRMGIMYPVKKGWYIRSFIASDGVARTALHYWPNGDLQNAEESS